MRFLQICLLLLLSYTHLSAQEYSMGSAFLKKVQSTEFAIKVESLKFDTSSFKELEIYESSNFLAPLAKLSKLKKLSFQFFEVGQTVDTIISFDPETFEEVVNLKKSQWNFPIRHLLEELEHFEELEQLELNFQNQTNYQDYDLALKSYGLIKEVLDEIKSCLKENGLATSLSNNRLYERIEFYVTFSEEGASSFKQDSLYPCFNKQELLDKWMKVFQYNRKMIYLYRDKELDGFDLLEVLGLEYDHQTAAEQLSIDYLFQLNEQLDASLAKIGLEALQSVRPESQSRAQLLADALQELKQLKSLKISNFPDLKDDWPILIKALAQLPKLETLEFENCPIKKIPPTLKLLTKLKRLSWTNSKIEMLGKEWANFTNLEQLDLSNNLIQNYGNLSKSPSVHTLILTQNTTYPSNLGQLTTLRELSLGAIFIEDEKALSRELQYLNQLEKLNLSYTAIDQWPEAIGKLKKLKKADLSHNNLNQWPTDFSAWKELEIDITANCLKAIPFKKMYKLKGEEIQCPEMEHKWAYRTKSTLKSTPILKPIEEDRSKVRLLSKGDHYMLVDPGFEKIAASKNFRFAGQSFIGPVHISSEKQHFDFEKFHLLADSLSELQIYIPLQKRNALNYPSETLSPLYQEALQSSLEGGAMLVFLDIANNKLGRKSSSKRFPSIELLNTAYVYYDKFQPNYGRKHFYLQIEPFILENNSINKDLLRFKAKFVSAAILAEQELEVRVMPHDLSLGFEKELTAEGLYWKEGSAKLKFTGLIELSNEGLLGQGELQTDRWKAQANYIKFMPEKVLIHAQSYQDQEGKTHKDVLLSYFPYKDQLFLSKDQLAFAPLTQAQFKLQDEALLWPLNGSSGEHYIKVEGITKASPFDFESKGQVDLKFHFPYKMAKILFEDLTDGNVLNKKELGPITFSFSDFKLNWEGESLINGKGDMELTSLLGQKVEESIKVKFSMKADPIKGDLLQFYMISRQGDWYYFSFQDNILTTVSSHPDYNNAVTSLRKKDRKKRLENKSFFEIIIGVPSQYWSLKKASR
jgi:Leucine-rich repeat (LRR) protein